MTPGEVYTSIESLIGDKTAIFDKGTVTTERAMWVVVFNAIRGLDTDNQGNILPNSNNLRKLRTLQGTAKRGIITKNYRKKVNGFLAGFQELKDISDKYFSQDVDFNPNKHVFKANLNSSIEATKNSLLEAGISENVIKPVENILKQNITAGGSIVDLTDSLRAEILGDSQTQGRLQRYSGQITNDALNQYNANHTLSVANDLGLEFYTYQGLIQTNSRDYCKRRVSEGRWFHIKEIKKTASEVWAGKMKSTTPSTILVNRGGFNCLHQYIPVSTSGVPRRVIQRVRSKGLIQ